jgi:hypothetical protein
VRRPLSYIIGVETWLYTYLPLRPSGGVHPLHRGSQRGHRVCLKRRRDRARDLAMVIPLASAMLFTYRGMRRRDADLMSPAKGMAFMAEFNRPMALAYAFGVAALLCRLAGARS